MTFILEHDLTRHECCLLGATMNAPEHFPAIAANLCGEDPFTTADHRAIWSAIVAVDAAGGTPGPDVVAARLSDDKTKIDPEYIPLCCDYAMTGANWPYFVRMVNEAAQVRILTRMAGEITYEAKGKTTPEALIGIASRALAKVLEADHSHGEIGLDTAIDDVRRRLAEQKPAFIPTGLRAFDNEFNGLPVSGMVTLLGVPSSGKSSLASRLAVTAAKHGIPTRVFSYEMGASMLAASMLSAEGEVSVHDYLRTGRDLEVDSARVVLAQDVLAPLPIKFVERSLTARQLHRQAEVYASQGVKCIVIDYLQNVAPDEGETDVERIANLCRTCQRLSRDFGMLVIAVSQMVGASTREDRPPRKSDGMGSAAIEQASDMILGVYRPCLYKGRLAEETDAQWSERRRLAEIHVLKNKLGTLGAVPVVFEGRWLKFMDVEFGR